MYYIFNVTEQMIVNGKTLKDMKTYYLQNNVCV